MFNYEEILANQVNYIKSCITSDGAILHRQPLPGIIDRVPVFPGEACNVALALIGTTYGSSYGEVDVVEMVILWYLNNIIPVGSPGVPSYAQGTIPSLLYTVNPDRSYTIEAVDYRFGEALATNDTTSPYYPHLTDPLYLELYEAYLRQGRTASLFLTLMESYTKYTQDYQWTSENLQVLSQVANVALNGILQFESGNEAVSLMGILTGAPNPLAVNVGPYSHLSDNIAAYNGFQGAFQLLGRVQNPASPIFQDTSLAIENGLNLFAVENINTQPVGVIFAEYLYNVNSQQVSFQTFLDSVETLEESWNAMSLQLQAYYALGINQASNVTITVPLQYNVQNLYNVLQTAYPTWPTQLPTSYNSQQPWLIAGAIALAIGDYANCVSQVIAANGLISAGWNILEASWCVTNIYQLIALFNSNGAVEEQLVWNKTLRTNIPASFEALFEIEDNTVINPQNANNSVYFYYGNPLTVNGATTPLTSFLQLVAGSNLLVLTDEGTVTDELLPLLHETGAQVYLYVPAGLGLRSQGLTDPALFALFSDYAKRGYDGVFLDAFDYAGGFGRTRQTNVIANAHTLGLNVFVNPANVLDVCAPTYDPTYNPQALPCALNSTDLLLLDEFGIYRGPADPTGATQGAYLTTSIAAAEAVNTYKRIYGFKVAALTYAAEEDTPSYWAYNPDNPLGLVIYNPANVGLETTLENYYGNQTVLQQVFGDVNTLGMGWVRNYCLWSKVAQGEVNNRDYTLYDTIVNGLIPQNNVMLVLAYDNTLAPITQDWATFVKHYLDYVTATVTHFAGRVAAWEVWNQENIAYFWQLPPDPAAYLTLLSGVYTIVQELDPSALVVLGSLGPPNVVQPSGSFQVAPVIDVAYATALYELGAAPYFDVMNVSPALPMPLLTGTSSGTLPAPTASLDYVIAMEELTNLMATYGDAQKPIWLTGVGLPTYTTAQGSITQAEQYFYLADFLKQLTVNPAVQRVFIKELVDAGTDPTYPPDNFGLMTSGLAPKQSYLFIKSLTRGTILPYNYYNILPTWENELQFAYNLFLMLGLDYFRYTPFFNLSFTLPFTPTPLPLVEVTFIEPVRYLSPLTLTASGSYLRNLHSGFLTATLSGTSYAGGFEAHVKPLMMNPFCPSCLSILNNLENNLPIDPYVVDGWGEMQVMEKVGWGNQNNNFGVTDDISSVTALIASGETLTNIDLYSGANLLLLQAWVFQDLLTLDVSQLAAGRWCQRCGLRTT